MLVTRPDQTLILSNNSQVTIMAMHLTQKQQKHCKHKTATKTKKQQTIKQMQQNTNLKINKTNSSTKQTKVNPFICDFKLFSFTSKHFFLKFVYILFKLRLICTAMALLAFCLPVNVYIVLICIIAGALPMFSARGCVPDNIKKYCP